jgi:hypothetical protein
VTRIVREQRGRDPRKLNLTIRLVAPRGTPRDVLIEALEKSIRHERVEPPITAIHWVNWKKGEGGDVVGGQYVPPQMWQALKDFYAAITHPKTRLRVGQAE